MKMVSLAPSEVAWAERFSINALRGKLSWSEKEVIIFGKGPSLREHRRFSSFRDQSITLNHACEVVEARLNHFTDLQALIDCAQTVASSSSLVVMPFFPHIWGVPTDRTLPQLARSTPILQEMVTAERLFTYSASNAPPVGNVKQLELRFFSAEAAFQLACYLGAGRVIALGVDGGSEYSNLVSTRARTRLLDNNRKSFDSQFCQLQKLEQVSGIAIEYPVSPHRIFVGATDTELIQFLVLKHSIETRASLPVQIARLPQVKRNLRDSLTRSRTPFSFSRFQIPSLMHFQGRALYLDSDMIVFSDISEVLLRDLAGKHIAVTTQNRGPSLWESRGLFNPGRQYSVMLIDCAKARWNVNDIIHSLRSREISYEELLHQMKIVPENLVDDGIDPNWNCLERYVAGETKLLHYTDVPSQPWRTRSNSNYEVWLDALRFAVSAGTVTETDLQFALSVGGIGLHVLKDLTKSPGELFPTSLSVGGSAVSLSWFQVRYFRLFATIRNTMWRLSRSGFFSRFVHRESSKNNSQGL